MIDKQNNNKFVQKSMHFQASNFKQMGQIQQIDILENHQLIDHQIKSQKSFQIEEKEEIYTNQIYDDDQNLKIMEVQNGKLQNEIFQMIDEIQKDSSKELLQNKIKELQQRVNILEKQIVQKDTIATELLRISSKQNSLIQKKLILISNIIKKFKDSQAKNKNAKMQMVQLEQTYFSLNEKCIQKESEIQELMKRLEPKLIQLFQVQTQTIMNAQFWTQTLLVGTQSVGICADYRCFNRIISLDDIRILPYKQQMHDTLFQNDMGYENFSSKKQFLQDNKHFQSKQKSLSSLRTVSIGIEPFSNYYQAANDQIKRSSKYFKISNQYSIKLGQTIDVDYTIETQATESEQCFKQFISFNVCQPLISIILMLTETKQIKGHDSIIQKLQMIKTNKISEVLMKLLKEHKFLKICLDKMIQKDSERQQQINSNVQIVYSEVTTNNYHKRTVHIHEEVNESRIIKENEKIEQKQCQIY